MNLFLDLAGILIASVALVWTFVEHRRNRPLHKLNEKIARLDLNDRMRERFEKNRPDIRATFETKYRLVIGNYSHYGTALNVNIRFVDKDDPIIESERKEKLPVEMLAAGESCPLVVALSMELYPPFKVVLSWEDANGRPETRDATLYG